MLAMLSTLSAPQQLSQNVTQQITLLLSSCHCRDDVDTRRMMAARCTLRSEDRNRLVAFMKQMLPLQGRRAHTPCVDSQMHTQKRRSQSLGGVHKTNSALQGRCAQTPCGGSHMHTQRRRSQSPGGITQEHMLPSRDDVHRHRVLAARCTLRGEDLNRMVAYPNISCPPGTMCTDTVWWQPDAHAEAKIAIAWCRPQMANQVGQPATFFWSSSTKR